MAFINIPGKDNSTTLSPDEFNYFVNKVNSLKLAILQGSGFVGALRISDVPDIDGWYFASESGVYTNAGNITVQLDGNLNVIIVSNFGTTFSLIETAIPQGEALETEVIQNSVKGVESDGIWNALYGTSGLSESIASVQEDTDTNTQNILSLLGGLNNQGQWNADTNTPDIDAIANINDYWIVSNAGTTDLDGETAWGLGDWAVHTATGWTRIDAAVYLSGTSLAQTLSIAGNNLSISAGNTITLPISDTQRTDEEIRDVASSQWINGINTTIVKDDALNTLKIDSTDTVYDDSVVLAHVTSDGSDHTFINQDVTITATPEFSNVLSANSATLASHLVRLDQLNSIVGGLNWQHGIIDQIDFTTAEPAAPVPGDRFINTVTGLGSISTSTTFTQYRIYEFLSDLTYAELTPQEGWTLWDESIDTNFTFNGTEWVEFGSTVSHNNTSGLQGGTAGEYYHFDSAQHAILNAISAANLSGTNTGDQDLSGYLLNTTDTLTGDLTLESVSTPTLILKDTTNNLQVRLRSANSYGFLEVDNGDSVGASQLKIKVDGSDLLVIQPASSVFNNDVSATNLSGTNTGDQDLSGYLLNTTDTFTGTLTVAGDMNITGTFQSYINGSSLALQRMDTRIDATNYSRMHWYGNKDDGATSNFRSAWYDGSSYINITAASGTATFGGNLAASNLSGTNTGDQDLSGYLLNTTDTLTGDLTVTGDVKADTHFTSSDTNATLSTLSDGTVFLRPDGKSSTTGQSTFTTASATIGTSISATNLSGTNTGDQDLSSYIETSTADGKYLLNTNDTFTGELSIANTAFTGLSLTRNSVNGSNIDFNNSNGLLGRIGFLSDGSLAITNDTIGTYNMMHVDSSGNITATNLSGTNTGDNAVNSLYSGLVSYPGDQDLSGYLLNTSDTFNGTLVIDGGTGVGSTGLLHIRQDGDWVGNGIAITSSHASSHRIFKDANGNLRFTNSSGVGVSMDLSGNISANNLSGTNTGDQDLSGYLTSLDGAVLTTTDQNIGGIKTFDDLTLFNSTLQSGYQMTVGTPAFSGNAYSIYAEGRIFTDGDVRGTSLTCDGIGEFKVPTTTSGQLTVLTLVNRTTADQDASMTADIDFLLQDDSTTSGIQARIGVVGTSTATNDAEAGGKLRFYTSTASTLNPVLTNRMEIDELGHVSIGISQNGYQLSLGDFDGGSLIADGRIFSYTSIDSGGSISAGGTITGSNLSGTNTGDQDLSGYSTTDTNTTYTAGTGLLLDGTEFKINGGEIASGVDLNTMRTTGIFAQNSNADTTSGSNWPENGAGVLEVWNDDYGNGLFTTQRYKAYNNVNDYSRAYYSGSWTAWRNLTQDTNTTYDLSGYLLNTTDTLNGKLTISHSDPRLTLYGTATSNSYEDTVGAIDFYTNDASSHGQAVNAKIEGFADDVYGRLGLRFFTGGIGAPTEKMRIAHGGNVTFTNDVSANNLSGTNTGDQDLSGLAATSHTHTEITSTNLGDTATTYEAIATGTWDRPIGHSTMTQSGSVGKPSGATHGYWKTLGRRDSSGGYVGMYINNYNTTGSGVWIGRNATGGDPTWEKIYTDKTFPKEMWNIDNTTTTAGYRKIGTFSDASASSRLKITMSGGYGYGAGLGVASQDTIMLSVHNNGDIEGSWYNNGTAGITSVYVKTVSFNNTFDIYADLPTYSEWACEATFSAGTFIGESTVETPTGGAVLPNVWSVNNSAIKVDVNGNVGIGKGASSISTLHKVDIDGTLRVQDTLVLAGAGTTADAVKGVSFDTASDFTYTGNDSVARYLPHYGLGFHKPTGASSVGGNGLALSGYFGMDLFTGGAGRVKIHQLGQIDAVTPLFNIRNSNAVSAQTTILEIRNDSSADQTSAMTADIDFFLEDNNTVTGVPQGRIGIYGDSTASQDYEAGGRLAFYTATKSNASPVLTRRMVINDVGYVGINDDTPSYPLDVNGIIRSNSRYYANDLSQRTKYSVWSGSTYGIGMGNSYTFGGLNSYATTFQMSNNADRGWWFGDSTHTNAQGAMALTTGGNLTIAGKMRIGYGESDTSTIFSYGLDVTGTIRATGDMTATNFALSSDARLKKDFLPLESKRLKPSRWTWKDSGEKDFGFIAQDLEVDFPEVVIESEDGFKKVAYNKITAINASRINELEDENQILKDEVTQLKEKMESIMKHLNI